MASPNLRHVYELYIRTTPEQLWKAITSPDWTKRYFYESIVESDWKVGSTVVHRDTAGDVMLEGKVIEFKPPRRLVTTFVMTHNPQAKNDPASKVIWEIEKKGSTCKLTLIHEDFENETVTYREVKSGWVPVLSGLKTLLETGESLVIEQPKDQPKDSVVA